MGGADVQRNRAWACATVRRDLLCARGDALTEQNGLLARLRARKTDDPPRFFLPANRANFCLPDCRAATRNRQALAPLEKTFLLPCMPQLNKRIQMGRDSPHNYGIADAGRQAPAPFLSFGKGGSRFKSGRRQVRANIRLRIGNRSRVGAGTYEILGSSFGSAEDFC